LSLPIAFLFYETLVSLNFRGTFFLFSFCISSSFLSFLQQPQLIMAQNESLKMTSIIAAGETSSRSSSKLRDEADLARVGKKSVLKVRRSTRYRE
jgi:hypothetical protein